jgi:hypothetical protein
MQNRPVSFYGVAAYNSEDLEQPPEIMSVPDHFHAIIGRMVIRWATMEQ